MSRETFDAALCALAKVGIRDVRLTGGEPTIHPKFEEFLEVLREGGFSSGLVSNGVTLVRREASLDKLKLLSRCWISLYGPSDDRHARTSGRHPSSFHETIRAVGRAARGGASIGLSVSIAPGDAPVIEPLMEVVLGEGITRLRFLPLQPDGRAAALRYNWGQWPREIEQIACIVGGSAIAKRFEVLTVNDAFALSGRYATASCLLHHRRMFAIVPDGSIYPCCFTVYTPAARLGSVHDLVIEDTLRRNHGAAALTCRGLRSEFWRAGDNILLSCPVSSIDPRTSLVAA